MEQNPVGEADICLGGLNTPCPLWNPGLIVAFTDLWHEGNEFIMHHPALFPWGTF
jgi:hypothetical protein